MKNSFKKVLKSIVKNIKSNFAIILDLMFLITIFFLLNDDKVALIITIVIYIIVQFIKAVINKYKITIPTVNKKLTIKNENGDIVPVKGCLNEVIIYCNVIEEYIEDNNLR